MAALAYNVGTWHWLPQHLLSGEIPVPSSLAFAWSTSGTFYIQSLSFFFPCVPNNLLWVFSAQHTTAADDTQNHSPTFSLPCTANELFRVRVCNGKLSQEAATGRMMTQGKALEAEHKQKVISPACVCQTSGKKMFLHSPLALLPWTGWLLGIPHVQRGSRRPESTPS